MLMRSLALPPSENNQVGARRRSNRRRLDVDSPRRSDRPPQSKPKYWKDRLTERVDYLLGLHQEDEELLWEQKGYGNKRDHGYQFGDEDGWDDDDDDVGEEDETPIYKTLEEEQDQMR